MGQELHSVPVEKYPGAQLEQLVKDVHSGHSEGHFEATLEPLSKYPFIGEH